MNASQWLLVILTCLATHRATRFLTRDHLPLIAVPRAKITQYLDPPPSPDDVLAGQEPRKPWGVFGWSLAFLLECDWCMSVWVAAGIVSLEIWVFDLNVPYPILLGAAASTITGLIAQREPE
jgi:uncharacterized protein DUF1360